MAKTNIQREIYLTGSSSGIGLVTARLLEQKRFKVYGLFRKKVKTSLYKKRHFL